MSPHVVGALCVAAAFLVGALGYLWSEGGRLIDGAEAEIGTDDDDDWMAVADALQVDPDVARVRQLASQLPAPVLEAQIAAFDFSLWALEFEA